MWWLGRRSRTSSSRDRTLALRRTSRSSRRWAAQTSRRRWSFATMIRCRWQNTGFLGRFWRWAEWGRQVGDWQPRGHSNHRCHSCHCRHRRRRRCHRRSSSSLLQVDIGQEPDDESEQRLLMGLALMVTLVAFSLVLGLIYFWWITQITLENMFLSKIQQWLSRILRLACPWDVFALWHVLWVGSWVTDVKIALKQEWSQEWSPVFSLVSLSCVTLLCSHLVSFTSAIHSVFCDINCILRVTLVA